MFFETEIEFESEIVSQLVKRGLLTKIAEADRSSVDTIKDFCKEVVVKLGVDAWEKKRAKEKKRKLTAGGESELESVKGNDSH